MNGQRQRLAAAYKVDGDLGCIRVPDDVASFQDLTSRRALDEWRRRRRVRQGVMAGVVVLASVLLLQARPGDPIDYEGFVATTGLDLGAVTWEAPTDFLLDTPGGDLVDDVPTIDVHVPLFVPDSTPTLLPNDSQRRSPL